MNPLIVAEVGSNWREKNDCIYAIRLAKLSGADAVKFQLYTSEALYGVPGEASHELPAEWIPGLAEYAKSQDIEFMCSAFSPGLAKIVDPYVKRHKIASSEMNHQRLLEKIGSLRRPVVLSTAASVWPDIEHSIGILKEAGARDITLMYCVGSYPAKDIDLGAICMLREKSGLGVGYSDHSLDVRHIPKLAVQEYGATILEKHFNALDPHIKTPDSPHSLNPREFKIMADSIRGFSIPLFIGPTPDERDMMLRHKRRLKVIKPIKAGELFQEGYNFGIFRSLRDDIKALSPFAVGHVDKKKATVDLNTGDGIGPKDFT